MPREQRSSLPLGMVLAVLVLALLTACGGSGGSDSGAGSNAGSGSGTSSDSGTGSGTSSGNGPTLTTATPIVISNGTGGMSFTLDVVGQGFVAANGSTPGSQITVDGKTIGLSQYASATEITGVTTAASGTSSITVAVENPGSAKSNSLSVPLNANPPVSARAAARFLDQATFGPTPADINAVQSEGFLAYLNQQFSASVSPWPTPIPASQTGANCPVASAVGCLQRTWLYNAVAGPDQVRQRMAFALESIWVISSTKVNRMDGYAYYLAVVNADALGNWRKLMQDITLTPAMGHFLDMLNSGTPVGSGQIANENYGREFMQLFDMGLYQLNLDGTQKLDASGNPEPSYTQEDVEANARALTGWTLANGSAGNCQGTSRFSNYNGAWNCPMTPVTTAHDSSAKTLLGVQQPAGQDPMSDLSFVMNTVFNDPNVAPFVCRQLIEHLVTSNPSPQYVARVATVFNDDGSGTRGNLQAVVTAILLDPEARAGDSAATEDAISDSSAGHLAEPVVYVTRLLRALGASSTPLQLSATPSLPDYSGAVLSYYGGTADMGQNLLGSFSVFNFFPPAYQIPLAYTPRRTQALQGPEFALQNTATMFVRYNFVSNLVGNTALLASAGINLGGTSPTNATTCGASPLCTLAQNDINNIVGDTLLDTLNLRMMHDQMPKDMYDIIDSTVKSSTDPATRVRLAVYLIATSSQYMVIE